jgi:hypothetical protein
VQRKLNEMQKGDNPNTVGHIGQSGHEANSDLEKIENLKTSANSKNKHWASSSVRVQAKILNKQSSDFKLTKP